METEGCGAVSAARVTIAETGETFTNQVNLSILESLQRLGKAGIPVGCRSGGCSVCKVEILDGAWRQCRPMSREYVNDEDLAAGRVLACCVTPTADVTLRVVGKMRKAVMRDCRTNIKK
jgi:ferredoxin